MGIFKTLTGLNRVKANQNGTFLYLRGEIDFENVLFFEKEV